MELAVLLVAVLVVINEVKSILKNKILIIIILLSITSVLGDVLYSGTKLQPSFSHGYTGYYILQNDLYADYIIIDDTVNIYNSTALLSVRNIFTDELLASDNNITLQPTNNVINIQITAETRSISSAYSGSGGGTQISTNTTQSINKNLFNGVTKSELLKYQCTKWNILSCFRLLFCWLKISWFGIC